MSDESVTELLKSGGVGLLPADTVYGLSCMALNKDSVGRIYKLKGRDYNLPFIILLSDIEQAAQLNLDPKDLHPAEKFWPAPLTLIVPGKNSPAFLHRGRESLAVRIPPDAGLRDLIKQTGPIVSTSANPQGQPPAKNVGEAKEYFGSKLDFYVDAGTLEAQPSTIVEVKNDKLIVTRQGSFRLPAED